MPAPAHRSWCCAPRGWPLRAARTWTRTGRRTGSCGAGGRCSWSRACWGSWRGCGPVGRWSLTATSSMHHARMQKCCDGSMCAVWGRCRFDGCVHVAADKCISRVSALISHVAVGMATACDAMVTNLRSMCSNCYNSLQLTRQFTVFQFTLSQELACGLSLDQP